MCDESDEFHSIQKLIFSLRLQPKKRKHLSSKPKPKAWFWVLNTEDLQNYIPIKIKIQVVQRTIHHPSDYHAMCPCTVPSRKSFQG
jgi:hypothetical protein